MTQFQTSVTKAHFEGKRVEPDAYNGKPYRSAKLKAEAKEKATKKDDGAFRTTVPVLYHPKKDAK